MQPTLSNLLQIRTSKRCITVHHHMQQPSRVDQEQGRFRVQVDGLIRGHGAGNVETPPPHLLLIQTIRHLPGIIIIGVIL